MNKEALITLLQDTGVLLNGHFQLTSGRHSGQFLQCSQLLQYPDKAETVCRLMAEPYRKTGIETVIGPAMGGILLAYEVARQLGARAVFTEKDNGQMALKRGFTISPGEKVLVVEDAVTTGGSVEKVLAILRQIGASIVAVSVIVDRSAVAPDFKLPMHALLKFEIESYVSGDCPLCRAGIPLVKPKA